MIRGSEKVKRESELRTVRNVHVEPNKSRQTVSREADGDAVTMELNAHMSQTGMKTSVLVTMP